MNKAVLYARRSTVRQAGKSGVTRQSKKLRTYAKVNNYPATRFTERLLRLVGAFEKQMLSDRIKRGIQAKKEAQQRSKQNRKTPAVKQEVFKH